MYPRSVCCGYVGLDELSTPLDVENWDCAWDMSDGVGVVWQAEKVMGRSGSGMMRLGRSWC